MYSSRQNVCVNFIEMQRFSLYFRFSFIMYFKRILALNVSLVLLLFCFVFCLYAIIVCLFLVIKIFQHLHLFLRLYVVTYFHLQLAAIQIKILSCNCKILNSYKLKSKYVVNFEACCLWGSS